MKIEPNNNRFIDITINESKPQNNGIFILADENTKATWSLIEWKQKRPYIHDSGNKG